MERIREYFFIFVLIGLCAGCSPQDNDKSSSITFNDDILREVSLRKISEADVPVRVDGNTIWFSPKHADKVQSIFKDALIDRPIPFTFPEESTRDQYVKLLQDSGIEASVGFESDGYIAFVPSEKHEEASEIFRDLILDRR
jgi:hypothetical protein